MAKLKICGLTREADITAVNEVKPDFAGFVIEVPGRKRSITAEQVKVLVKGLDDEILSVGVFVDAPPELPISLLRDGTLWAAQLHGNEDEDYIEKIQNMTGKPVIKAFSIKTPQDVQRALRSPADYILLDQGGGGTGTAFDWELGAACEKAFPGRRNRSRKYPKRYCNPSPWAVDMSSSLETDGKKDPEKIRQIARMLKQINTLENYRKEREAK